MAINETNDELVDMLGAFFVRNDGELHLSTVATAANPYNANKYSVILGTGGALGIQINLPLAANNLGKVYCIKKVDAAAGVVRVARTGADLIDGAIALNIAAQYRAYIFVSDGVSNWYILSSS